jgi:hypothetical protein
MRANLEARGRHTQGWKPLHEELNNYSNYFPMDFPPWKKSGIPRGFQFPN